MRLIRPGGRFLNQAEPSDIRAMSDDELIETQRFLMKLLWSVHKDWLSAEQKWTLGGLSDFITRYGVNERGLRLNKHQLLKR